MSYTLLKKVSDIPFPVGMSLTKLSLGGRMVKLFPLRESLVSDRNVANLFYGVGYFGGVLKET